MEKGFRINVPVGPPTYTAAQPEEILRFQIERIMSAMFREILVVFDSLAAEHDIAMNKLEKELPADIRSYVALADYLNVEKRDWLRKQILDTGNHRKREIERLMEEYTIGLKK